jgi:hypothetical protein
MKTYLEFIELDDYIAHLRERTNEGAPLRSNIELGSVIGEKGLHGIRPISFCAVLTHIFDDHIACYAKTILFTTNYDLDFDDHRHKPEDKVRNKLQAIFEQYCKQLADEKHLTLTRGRWMFGAPEYLK